MPTPPPEKASSASSTLSGDSRFISEEDVLTIVEKFCYFLSQLKFDEAQTHIESHKLVVTVLPHAADKIWQQIMVTVAQLASAEQSYFTLSFFTTKFSFTKNNNNLKELYTRIRQDLRRIEDNANSPFSDPEIAKNDIRKSIVNHFCDYAGTRIELIDFYSNLQGKDWRSVVDESLAKLNAISEVYNQDGPSPLSPQPDLISKELQLLILSFDLKKKLSRCSVLDSLLLLKNLKTLFSNFFKDISQELSSKQSNSGLFSFMKPNKAPPKYFLLNWLVALYNSMLAKFSIYFNDVLGPYVPSNELKQFQTANTPINMYNFFSTFMRKQGPSVISIVMCRGSDQSPFYGFGYHKFLQESPLDTVQPSKDRFPVLMSMVNERYKSYDLLKSKIDDFLSLSHQAAHSEAKPKFLSEKEKNSETTFFCIHIEWQLFLVVYFDKKIAEKDASVTNFLNDVVGFLRFTKLYQELRTPSRTNHS
ncbi:hypothetical protein FO519_005809 [Halicephalobus sp. NKZ332]|nr:hypothetical protein FO519_005809 [Halicephalobus sp. NKZ332]